MPFGRNSSGSGLTPIQEEIAVSPQTGITSFRTHLNNRAAQGATYYNGLIYCLTDRDETFSQTNTGAGTLENIITVYDLYGNLIDELRDAYTGTDPGGAFMSFGAPEIINGDLYATVYNINGGGFPLISRVVRYTLNPLTLAEVISIGSDTAEHVSLHDGLFFVCYYDLTDVRVFNSLWSLVATLPLGLPNPTYGGAECGYWDGEDYYIIMHGPNWFGLPESRELRRYTYTGAALNYVETLTAPLYGTTQGFGAYPGGFVWADRPGSRVVFTRGLSQDSVILQSHPYRSQIRDLFYPTLQNGWVAFDAVYDRTAKVYVDYTGRVHFEGMIKNGTVGLAFPIFTLPASYRPKYSKNFPAVANDAFAAIGVVGNKSSTPAQAGQVVVRAGSNVWLSLDGISFMADSDVDPALP